MQEQSADTGLAKTIAHVAPAATTLCPTPTSSPFGDRTIAPHTRVDGPVAVAHGNLDVYGTVIGDVVAVDGNIHVHPGARVTGDAWAAAGAS